MNRKYEEPEYKTLEEMICNIKAISFKFLQMLQEIGKHDKKIETQKIEKKSNIG